MIIVTILGFALVIVGAWGMLTRDNIIRIIIGFSIIDTGIHLIIVSIGYIRGRTAPIIDQALPAAETASRAIDPVPSALVLTAIVIGLAVTALMLTYAVKLRERGNSLSIDEYKELKW